MFNIPIIVKKKGAINRLKNLLLGLTLVATSSASGYEFIKAKGDRNFRWKLDENGRRELKYYVDPKCPKEFEEVFIESARKWTDALDGKITFVSSKNAEKRDIYLTLEPPDSDDVAWVSSTPSEESDSKNIYIKSSKIKFNEKKEISDLILLKDIMTHELGHVLGLSDIEKTKLLNIQTPFDGRNDYPTMFQTIGRKYGIRATLHLDDIDGVRSLYELPEWQDRTLEDTIYIKRIRGRKYRFFVSSDNMDENLIWDFNGKNKKLLETGLETEIVLKRDNVHVHKRDKYGKRYEYLKVTLEYNGKLGEYEIPIQLLRKAKRETIFISPRNSEE
ncbi:MAG: hypothetical protein Q8L29_01875 [archaeon]|nr:hypothetical protein [archaeon]